MGGLSKAHGEGGAEAQVLSDGSVLACPDGSDPQQVAFVPGARTCAICDRGVLVGSDLGSQSLFPLRPPASFSTYMLSPSWKCFPRGRSTCITPFYPCQTPCSIAFASALLPSLSLDPYENELLAFEGTSSGELFCGHFPLAHSSSSSLTLLFHLHQPLVLAQTASASSLGHAPCLLAVGLNGRILLAHCARRGQLRVRDRSLGERIDRAAIVNSHLVVLCDGAVACVALEQLLAHGGSAMLSPITSGALDIASSIESDSCVSVTLASLVDHSDWCSFASSLSFPVPPHYSANNPDRSDKTKRRKSGNGSLLPTSNRGSEMQCFATVSASAENALETASATLEHLAASQATVDRESNALSVELTEYADALHVLRAMRYEGGKRQSRAHVDIDAAGDMSGHYLLVSARVVNGGSGTMQHGWSLCVVARSLDGRSATQATTLERLLPNESCSSHMCLQIEPSEADVFTRLIWKPTCASDAQDQLQVIAVEPKSFTADALRASQQLRVLNPASQQHSDHASLQCCTTTFVALDAKAAESQERTLKHLPAADVCWRGTVPRWGSYEIRGASAGGQVVICGSNESITWLIRAAIARRAQKAHEPTSLAVSKASETKVAVSQAQEQIGRAAAAKARGEQERAQACAKGALGQLQEAHKVLRGTHSNSSSRRHC